MVISTCKVEVCGLGQKSCIEIQKNISFPSELDQWEIKLPRSGFIHLTNIWNSNPVGSNNVELRYGVYRVGSSIFVRVEMVWAINCYPPDNYPRPFSCKSSFAVFIGIVQRSNNFTTTESLISDTGRFCSIHSIDCNRNK
jgi:hypothetical protein